MNYSYIIFSLIILLGNVSESSAREFKHLKFNASLKKSDSMVNILSELYELLDSTHAAIGQSEVDRILEDRDLGGGVLNFSGFSWYKPMANFEIMANREISPELYSDKWIVHDTFTIYIDAATLLTNLRSEGTIEITDKALALFVGLNFTRKYHYYHFASTYENGLTSDFSKLFLLFDKFSEKALFTIKDSEILKREDLLQMNAKGALGIPITTGISLGAVGSASLAYKNEFSYQHIEDNSRRLSLDSSFKAKAGSELAVKLDFFGVLQATLLSHELEYEITKSDKTNLAFDENQLEELKAQPKKFSELKSYIKGKTKIDKLSEYLVSTEQREEENLKSKFGFLLFGDIRKKAKEQIKIVKDGVEKVFYKTHAESVSYIQSLLSRIFSKLIYRIFKFEKGIANKVELSKKLSLEYERTKELNHRVIAEESLSVNLAQSFKANSLSKKSYRERTTKHLKMLTNLDLTFEKKINDKKILGPVYIQANLELNTNALRAFNSLDQKKVIKSLLSICQVDSELWPTLLDEKERRQIFRERLNKSLRCAKTSISRYFDYTDDLAEYKSISIEKFERFLGFIFSKANSYHDLTPLFGKDNIFIHGEFKGSTDKKLPFLMYFKAGQFQEFGVIDRFKLLQTKL